MNCHRRKRVVHVVITKEEERKLRAGLGANGTASLAGEDDFGPVTYLFDVVADKPAGSPLPAHEPVGEL